MGRADVQQALYVQVCEGPTSIGWAAAVVTTDGVDVVEAYRRAHSCNGVVPRKEGGEEGIRTVALATAAALAWAGGRFAPAEDVAIALQDTVLREIRAMPEERRRAAFAPLLRQAADLGISTRAVRGDSEVLGLLHGAARIACSRQPSRRIEIDPTDPLGVVGTMWASGLIETRHARRAVIETLLGRHDVPALVSDISLRTPADLDSPHLRKLAAQRGEAGRVAVQEWAARLGGMTGSEVIPGSQMRQFQ